MKADLRKDSLFVDRKAVTIPKKDDIVWIMFHKPKNVLTIMNDEKNRHTVSTYVEACKKYRLIPVGGMDRDETGLLLLTNDVAWIHPLCHHAYQHMQRYIIILQGPLDVPKFTRIEEYDDKPNEIDIRHVELLDKDPSRQLFCLELQLAYGSPHDLLPLFEEIGCTLISSRRVQYGPIVLRKLKRGASRRLTEAEITKLKTSCIPSARPDKRKKRHENIIQSAGKDALQSSKEKKESKKQKISTAPTTATNSSSSANAMKETKKQIKEDGDEFIRSLPNQIDPSQIEEMNAKIIAHFTEKYKKQIEEIEREGKPKKVKRVSPKQLAKSEEQMSDVLDEIQSIASRSHRVNTAIDDEDDAEIVDGYDEVEDDDDGIDDFYHDDSGDDEDSEEVEEEEEDHEKYEVDQYAEEKAEEDEEEMQVKVSAKKSVGGSRLLKFLNEKRRKAQQQ